MQLEIISNHPAAVSRPTPVLFVHGAWHGAWCWQEHFLEYFGQQGYAARAVSLRAHGESEGREKLRWTRISQYVEDVAQAAGQFPTTPAVVGHSMGGLVIQKYLETHAAPAGVLMATVPPAGALATTLRIAARHPLEFLKTNLTWSLYPLVGTPELARESFFSKSMPEAQVREYARRIQDESYCAFLDMLALNLPRPARVKTPMLVLGGGADQIFHPAEVEATARAYQTQAVMFPEMAHDMMLEAGWAAAAERIVSWLKERGL